jgi:hypothetical protein
LIHQACLARDQPVLISGQHFQFCDDGTIWLQLLQSATLPSTIFQEQRRRRAFFPKRSSRIVH